MSNGADKQSAEEKADAGGAGMPVEAQAGGAQNFGPSSSAPSSSAPFDSAPFDSAAEDRVSQVRTRFDFYSLSRPVQDRFLASATGRGVPEVVLFAPAARSVGAGWLILLVVGTVGLIMALTVGYADLESSYAIQPVWFVLVYALCAGAAGLGLMGFTWARASHLRFPYRLGSYFFPCGVFVAHDEHLQLFPIADLKSVSAQGERSVKLAFSSRSFVFSVPAGLELGALQEKIDSFKARFQKAYAMHNRRELAALDPIRDSGFSNPLSSKDPIRKPADQRVMRYTVGLVVGLVLGAIGFGVRNTFGKQALYAEARKQDTAQAYRDYLARGGERADVRELLLPRAELQATVGSLDAVEQYIEANPDSKIMPEIEAVLHKELLKALEEVKRKGTLAAIAEFKQAHPRHQSILPQLQAARTQVFEVAHERFVAATDTGEEAHLLFRKILEYSNKNGPAVEVRFRRNIPRSAERADTSIRRSAYYTGPSSLPAQYLGEKHALPREQEAAKAIIDHLQPLFPEEIIKFVPGKFEEGFGKPPAVDKPTLFVSYTTEMSGGYTTQRPRGVYVGLGLMVRAEFRTPDGKRWLSLKDSSWLPPDVNEIWRESLRPEQVYDRNARLGFKRFLDKYLGTTFPVKESAGGAAAEGASPTGDSEPEANASDD